MKRGSRGRGKMKLDMNSLSLVVLVLGIGLVSYLIMKSQKKTCEGYADDNRNGAKVMFFFADWCPHCTKAKPEWNKLKKIKTIKGKEIEYVDVDCTKNDSPSVQAKLKKHNVSGFPTFKVLIGDKSHDYNGSPNHKEIEKSIAKPLG